MEQPLTILKLNLQQLEVTQLLTHLFSLKFLFLETLSLLLDFNALFMIISSRDLTNP
jgi:hypothetical protein